MAYQIQYELNTVRVIRRDPKRELLGGAILVVMLVVGTISAHIGGTLLQMMLLGSEESTQAATEQLIDDFRSGIRVKDAIQTFCAELLP